MAQRRLGRLGGTITALVVIIALLVLADLVYAGALITRQTSVHLAPAAAQASPKAKPDKQAKAAHPCNHGFYVSQAAHSKKGGGYVSGIAQSDLGKDGNCSAPLPAQAPAATPKSKKS
ncbi:MAG: hypothetical protein E6I11_13040 [Chloroflexi bacterium]|nr:MAG: hypothetical protein E6I11_13040 [Chloroflexota bacterium]TMG12419.1 MAG: hypothetical protein E6I00_06475 [Chloroflexota bacterium]